MRRRREPIPAAPRHAHLTSTHYISAGGCLVSYGVEVALLATGHMPREARHPGNP